MAIEWRTNPKPLGAKLDSGTIYNRAAGFWDLFIIQGPFSVAPCQTLISRFVFFIAVGWRSQAQEIAYALRPTPLTKRALAAHKQAIGWPMDGTAVHGMQVRRTDKVAGKLKEADAVPLSTYTQRVRAYLSLSLSPSPPPGGATQGGHQMHRTVSDTNSKW
jgi:hypothetical protein